MEKSYKGYTIEYEKGHYKVTGPNDMEWTEDTYKDAKEAIDEEIKANRPN